MSFKTEICLFLLILFLPLVFAAAAETEPEAYFSFEGHLEDEMSNYTPGQIIGEFLGPEPGRVTEETGLDYGSISFTEGRDDGQAAVFDGSSGLLLPGDLITDHSYSVALWVYPKELTSFTTTFFGAAAVDEWVSVVPQGPIGGETMVWSGEDWYDAHTGFTIPQEQWSHIAFTVNKGTIKVYINGQSYYYGTGFPDIFSDQEGVFALGVNWWDPAFVGYIDDLKIYDSTLNAFDIMHLAEGAPEIKVEESPFTEVSVHDPMITEDDGTYYIFGSHLASAKSDDLIKWTQLSRDWQEGNPLIPGLRDEIREAMNWPDPPAESTWAKSVVKIEDEYHMYFSTSTWGAVRSAIALATADDIEGPYEYEGFVVRSYDPGEENEAGVPHDPDIHPNAIDPHVFFDSEGQLWMIYGSYAGGIYILKMDPETGLPLPDQGYGTKVSGGHHAAMEGPYIQYNPETDYYYYMVSFGSLGPNDGYNIRIARSRDPEGPFYDPAGQSMLEAEGPGGWQAIEEYGGKLIGNFEFRESGLAYVSPGHNSAYYDEQTKKMYVIFHTRFPGLGQAHNVRVHQMLINEREWPVIMPHRYAGEEVGAYSEEEIQGTYQYINHGQEITADIKTSENIELQEEGLISGAYEGSWEMTGDYTAEIIIQDETYYGVFLKQWDDGLKEEVMTFSALSEEGIAIWGSQIK